jgi:hypothetical protein
LPVVELTVWLLRMIITTTAASSSFNPYILPSIWPFKVYYWLICVWKAST